jgi:hypothetical protein
MTKPIVPDTDNLSAPATLRRIARRPGPKPVMDALERIVLDEEDAVDLRNHCRTLSEKVVPQCEYDQFLVQLSASNTWRARRFVLYEGSLVNAAIEDQTPRVDREFVSLDSHSRASMALRDPEFLKILRYVRDTETTCLRRAKLLNQEVRTPPAR